MTAVLTSGRQVDGLVGPDWAGKTRTLPAVHAGWEAAHGLASVFGLAPSASAAAELATAVGIACDTVAKWQHEASKAKRTSGSGPSNDGGEWRLQPGQTGDRRRDLVAGTLTLDQLAARTRAAGAKLLLVGDHHQLGAVDGGRIAGPPAWSAAVLSAADVEPHGASPARDWQAVLERARAP
jgi:ATP-dependent exoDNAse (exonuclease V) alpha subunit